MNEVFTAGFVENLKILFVGLIIYAIIFAMLKKIDILGSEKVNNLIALLTAIIVSFTGIVTYMVSYAINWFVIIFFIIFLLIVILLFLGVNMGDITAQAKNNGKLIVIIFFLLFSIVLVKGFFGVNNQFDQEKNLEDYEVDTSPNVGFEVEEGFLERFNISVSDETLQVAIFLIIIGLFVAYMGK